MHALKHISLHFHHSEDVFVFPTTQMQKGLRMKATQTNSEEGEGDTAQGVSEHEMDQLRQNVELVCTDVVLKV